MKLFIGTGLLGSAFIKAMLERGDKVRVWNRTISKAQDLAAYGAEVCPDLGTAVNGIDCIHVALRDDTSVDEVLGNASSHLKKGATIVDHTTTSVQGAKNRTKSWKDKGITYQHAPVLMGPSNALNATGFILVSGDQSVIKRLEPELSKMTGEVLNVGETVGKAAGMKLIGNQFLMAVNAGLADSVNLAQSMGFSAKDVLQLFKSWDPGAVAKGGLKKVMKGDFETPSWELVMARKDARLMIEEAQNAGNTLKVIPLVADEMDKWIEKGHGHEDWTTFMKDSVEEEK